MRMTTLAYELQQDELFTRTAIRLSPACSKGLISTGATVVFVAAAGAIYASRVALAIAPCARECAVNVKPYRIVALEER